MIRDSERDYHEARAQAELDWSQRATHRAAVESHRQLSALHMQRAQATKSLSD
ncbi:MAG TPA: hypothetical protein VFO69_05555 [Allosphingosinicella sp.]|nr:hypothetical protein [Allosphingosinicella sp.]